MKLLGAQGVTDFVICCGYKGYMIKEYFANYFLHMSDVTFHVAENRMELHQGKTEPWRVTLVDTGDTTNTGGRLKRVRDHIDGTFCLTYGDGVANIDLAALVSQHRRAGLEATVTAIKPPGRYGALDLKGGRVRKFLEKPEGDGQWINGGFFICEPSVLSRISSDETSWEGAPLESLARDGQLGCYRHNGFWTAMDTLRDKRMLEDLWAREQAPWKIWV